jgi:threonine dehydrogenase-like Zn-dependent dehydrogenase
MATEALMASTKTTAPTKPHRGDLPDTMQALVAHAPGDYRLEEVPTPRAGEGEIVIKVEACGICAGDLKSFHGAPSFWGGAGNPPYIKAPVIPGHEFIGYIVELGENVDEHAHHGDTGFQVGDRVISEQIVPRWNDLFSTTGRYWMDEQHDVYGFQNNVDGGFAQYMKFPKEAINYKLPKDLPVEKAVLVEPYSCSKHGVDRAQITNDDVVVISGAGVIGLGMVGFAARNRPKKLIVLDLIDARLEKALEFGADEVLNPSNTDVVGRIREQTGGYGADIYIEVSGHAASVQQGLEVLRKMGRFVEFSVFKDLVTVDWSIISDRKELDVLGGHLGPYCYRPTIEWISDGSLPTEDVVTHKLPLSEWQKGFETVADGSESIKVILFPNEEFLA